MSKTARKMAQFFGSPFISRAVKTRLQNSPNFCVFKYARAVQQKVWNVIWNEAENRERDWGETPRVRLLRHPLPISLLILRKKPTVLQSRLKPKIPFHVLFLLRNQTETLATQAIFLLMAELPEVLTLY